MTIDWRSISKFGLIVILIGPIPGCQHSSVSNPKYIGGEIATDGQFPSSVQLAFTGSPMPSVCTAVKIAKNIYLTAAHCNHWLVPPPGFDLTIAWGAQLIPNSTQTRKVKVVASEAHASANASLKKANDVVKSLKMQVPPPDSKAIGAAFIDEFAKGSDFKLIAIDEEITDIPSAEVDFSPLKVGNEVIVGGYGRESLNGPSFGRLRYAKKTVSLILSATAEVPIEDTGGTTSKSSIAKGDSGGPVYTLTNGNLAVVAVNSLRNDPAATPGSDLAPGRISMLSGGSDWTGVTIKDWLEGFIAAHP